MTEAVLFYRPTAGGPAQPLGVTRNPAAIRALRDSLLADAARETRLWRAVDPDLARIHSADQQRLEKVLRLAVPDDVPNDGGAK